MERLAPCNGHHGPTRHPSARQGLHPTLPRSCIAPSATPLRSWPLLCPKSSAFQAGHPFVAGRV